MIFHKVIALPLTDIFLFWIKLNKVSVLDYINKYAGSANGAWRSSATPTSVSLHYSLTWKSRRLFLMRPNFIIPNLSHHLTAATNWLWKYIHLTYRESHGYAEIIFLLLPTLTKLLIKQQIHPDLLKCKGTLEPVAVEFREPLSIDYTYYSIHFSLH